MKKISEDLVADIKVVLAKGIHPKFAWEAITQLISSLNSLEEVCEETKDES